MTDKKLLELAAKAASIEFGWQHIFDNYEGSTSEKWDWNPLTDDGDALRLAVKLKILVDIGVDSSEATNGDYICHGICELHRNSDPYAATRRAVVRAAAEIGKTK